VTPTEILQEFAKLLANSDEHERNAFISRAKLLAMQEAEPSAFEPPISTLAEYLATPIPVPPVLVEPALLVRGGLLCTIGRAGKGKTQMNLNRIMRWACGQPVFEGLTNKEGTPILGPSGPLKVLIIENEGAAGMFHRQVGTMLNAEGYLSPEQRDLVRENVLIWGDGGWSGLKLDDEQQLNNVRAGCEKWRPDIVFIEPFRGLWKGEENSATDMANVADALSGIAADFDCGVILTHHERKSGTGDDGEKMSAGRCRGDDGELRGCQGWRLPRVVLVEGPLRRRARSPAGADAMAAGRLVVPPRADGRNGAGHPRVPGEFRS